MFVRVTTKKVDDRLYHYAFLVENKKVIGKVVQKVVRNLGKITLDQLPYLKAAYMDKDKRPKLVYENEEG